MGVIDIRTVGAFEDIHSDSAIVVTHFKAGWVEQCKQISQCVIELSNLDPYKGTKFCEIEAENLVDISKEMKISSVPTVIISKKVHGGSRNILGRVEGAAPGSVVSLVKKIVNENFESGPLPSITPATVSASSGSTPRDPTDDDLRQLINSAPAILFMKGSPANPKCGFSRTTIQLLDEINAQYSTFDILQNEGVRQRLKVFSDWPTYPQLYVKGELLGGLDILKEMKQAGELSSIVPIKQSLDDRLKSLVNKAPIMVFMKGDRHNPKCGFSRSLIEIFAPFDVQFETFDILSDELVRQGLKKFSNWPTYPQVYVKGELIGGLDIIKEMNQDGSLLDALKSS